MIHNDGAEPTLIVFQIERAAMILPDAPATELEQAHDPLPLTLGMSGRLVLRDSLYQKEQRCAPRVDMNWLAVVDLEELGERGSKSFMSGTDRKSKRLNSSH